MNIFVRAVAAVLFLLGSLAAQDFGDQRVDTTARFEPASAAPGARVELVVTVTPHDGWHLYGQKDTTGLPPKLVVTKAGGLVPVGNAPIPDGVPHRVGSMTSYWLASAFEIRQGLTVPATAAAGEVEVGYRLDYMACTEEACDPPTETTGTAKLVVLAGGAPGGFEPLAPLGDEKVAVRARIEPNPARPGETVKLLLDVAVVDGWHIYGGQEELGLPTELKLGATGSLRPRGSPVMPQGEPHDVAGDTSWWLLGEFTIEQRLDVPEGTAPGPVTVSGKLHYMPCTESSCLNAADAEFEVVVEVEAGPVRAEASTSASPATDGPETDVAAPDEIDLGGSMSLWQIVLECFLGGLLALAMPCTYPMIPITFSFFTKQAELRGGNVLGLALIYGIGIVLMFVAIGLLVGPVIIPFAGHWVTNAVLAGAFFLFALSLFGAFTLQLPSFVQNAAGRAGATGGLLGVFFMGATLVVTSFTCTAPVMGLLLARAAKGSDMGGVALGMGVFGLTMALPFVVLSLLPGRVKQMPRSGEWMNALKYTLGYIELVAALKFVSNVDVYFDWRILPSEVFLGISALLFVLTAVNLWGILPRATQRVGPVRVGFGAGFALLAFWFVRGILGAPLDFATTAMLPPYSLHEVKQHDVVYDQPARARELAQEQGKLVLHNFTGFFCTNCRAVENDVFRRPAVAAVLRRGFIESRQHVDVQQQLTAEQFATNKAMQAEMVGTEAMPFYVVVDPKTGKRLRGTALSGPPGTWEQLMLDFLAGPQ